MNIQFISSLRVGYYKCGDNIYIYLTTVVGTTATRLTVKETILLAVGGFLNYLLLRGLGGRGPLGDDIRSEKKHMDISSNYKKYE